MSGQTRFMVALVVAGLCVGIVGVGDAQTQDKWRLGTQSWSFYLFTFEEAMAKTKSCEMKYIEAYPGQRIGGKFGTTVFKDMTLAQRQQVKQMLKDSGLTLTCYGVITPGNEQEWRKLFDFAKDMGFETIVSEPPESALAMIDQLCQEYQIGIAIHNHPKASGAHYWDYETVLKACEGCSQWIGSCADTGHWMRSGIDPLTAILTLGKAHRIRSLHFKDLNKFGDDAHDVPWGTGMGKSREILVALAALGLKGPFSAEYEYHWDNSVPEIKQSGEWFKKTAAELSEARFQDVFQKNLSNAVMEPTSWAFNAGGELAPGSRRRGDIWTKERYGNFILELDFMVPEKGDSGVFLRTDDIQNRINTAIEVQIHATTDGTKYGQCGAIYDCLPPSKDANKGPGAWNHYVITCLDNKIYVNLNGEDIIDMDLDLWTEAGRNPDGTPNMFTPAYKDMPRQGHLGFQYPDDPVRFKNLKIKSLD